MDVRMIFNIKKWVSVVGIDIWNVVNNMELLISVCGFSYVIEKVVRIVVLYEKFVLRVFIVVVFCCNRF